MTGIAATLLSGGQTVHKTSAIPVPCLDNSTCRISPNSDYGNILRDVLIFIIDEASMLSRYQFEAIDHLMRDLTGKDIPFGDKIFILGGDFRQTLPVVHRASDTVIIENSIISSHLWSIVYADAHGDVKIRLNDPHNGRFVFPFNTLEELSKLLAEMEHMA